MPEPTKPGPAVVMHEVRKSFGATHALRSVSMTIAEGSVHALVGENGAGKSTALGVLAGRIPMTSGHVDVFGEQLKPGDPRSSRQAGVVAIYQELTIVPTLSAEANVFLGQTLSTFGLLARKRMRAEYVALCARVGVRSVPPRTAAGSLSVADQQLLEILRAVISGARIILFDEPTAALAEGERQALYRLIENLRTEGVTIVFVSHNLDEVLQLADVITVFRDGELQTSKARDHFTKPILVRAMIGDSGDDRLIRDMLEDDELAEAQAAQLKARASRRSRGQGRPPILSATGVTVPGALANVDIEVRAGELVGLGGLVGSGRTTLLRALAGLEPRAVGRMFINGEEVEWPRTVRRALSHGIAMIPEDRKNQGLVLSMSSTDNIALASFGRTTRAGFLSRRTVEQATAPSAAAFGFRQDRLRHRASQLSGGNQQKLLLARWKHLTPKVLLADEPTRGIDVGAKADILSALEDMATDGLGLIMASSELEEVAAVSDRVYVLTAGRQAGVLDGRSKAITSAEILQLAFGTSMHPADEHHPDIALLQNETPR